MAEALAIIQTQQTMIESVRAEVQQLRTENQKLRDENEELRARLKRDSSNSSQPPSSDPPWKAPNKRRRGGKRGGQLGHRGHHRELVVPDCIEDHRPSQCLHCGERLDGEDTEPYRHQVTELPEMAATVTEHRVHKLKCAHCGHHTSGVLPADVPRGSFGPRLQAVIAVCSGMYHLSKRSIEELMHDFFGAQIALGSVSNVEQQVSEALAAPYQEARAIVQRSRVAHLDETGWTQGATRAWLWVAATPRVIVYAIRKTRSRKVAIELLRRWFRGVVVSDGFNAYHWVAKMRRQLCWAHIVREFRRLLDFQHATEFGERMTLAIARMFERFHQARDENLDLEAALAPHRQEIFALLEEGSRSSSKHVRRPCKTLLNREVSLWTFTRYPFVEPTNNEAERALRTAVLWRKGSFGTDSDRGSRFAERVLTIVMSLRLQKRQVLGYITEACRGRLVGQPPAPIWT